MTSFVIDTLFPLFSGDTLANCDMFLQNRHGDSHSNPRQQLLDSYKIYMMSENRKRPTSSRSMPIACRVCDKVFFDNVSLVLHFECHLEDEIFIPPRSHGRDLELLPGGRHLPLNLSPFSSSGDRMSTSEAHRAAFPKKNKRLRSLSVVTPNTIPTDACLVDVPVLNSVPQMNLYDARRNALSKPFRLSTRPLGHKNSDIKQPEKPVREIIVISDDDEEDENKNANEIDLTLKL